MRAPPRPPAARGAALGALVAAALLAPSTAPAQLGAVDVRAGVAPVVGQYRRDLDVGPTLAVGVTLAVAPSLGVRADARWATLRLLADGDIECYTLGVETQAVVVRGRFPVRVGAVLGGGASRLRFPERESWHPTVTGGVRLAADLARRVGVLADASASVTSLGDRRASLRTPVDAGGTLIQLPITAGLRLRF